MHSFPKRPDSFSTKKEKDKNGLESSSILLKGTTSYLSWFCLRKENKKFNRHSFSQSSIVRLALILFT